MTDTLVSTFWSQLLGTPFSLSYVDAGGIKTRSLQAGSGEPVIFLHGTSGHLEAFIRNIPAHAAEYEVHAIDMLGHGFTDKPDYPYEIPRYVEHLTAYMDALGMERAHIVGESLGGWVGGTMAISSPERIASLQLLCSGGTVANPEVMERIRRTTKLAVESDDPDLVRKRLQLLMADPADATEELVTVRDYIYHQESFVNNIDNMLCLQDMDTRLRNILKPEDLQQIKVPTWVVWGRNNPFGEVPEADAIHANIAGSELTLLDNCGHWPQHEQPEEYNRLSLEFLRQHPINQ